MVSLPTSQYTWLNKPYNYVVGEWEEEDYVVNFLSLKNIRKVIHKLKSKQAS